MKNEEQIEAGAKIVAEWLRHDWDGLGSRDISGDYPDFACIPHFNGGQPALRKLVSRVLAAALSTQPQAGEARIEGWTMVPTEPDVEMLAAWYRCKNGHHFHDEPPVKDTSDYAAYRAMLAASPAPSTATKFARSEEGVQLAAEVSEMARRVGKEFVPFVQPTASELVAVKALEDRVEDIAKWLHDEVEWPEYDFPDHSWPDHPDDDGKRGNGYLKIIPRSSADQFREIARRILSLVSPALPSRGELEEAFAERAIAAIKEISNPDNGLRDKFVMTGPGGILVMACNAVRAALGSRT